MTEPRKPIIVCKNIIKTYGQGENKCLALKGVDLSINQGELCLLMGPSGSGKTTLISIIAGILTPDGGECLINNVNFAQLSDNDKVHYRGKNIGFVFQAFNLIPMLTNEENISIPLLIQGVMRGEALDKAKALLVELGMKEKIGFFPADLSGGQQQRIAIARALVHTPSIIVCDEPTSFLDHNTGMKIMELLREMTTKKGVTVIVVTHDLRIVQYADVVHHLEDGQIVQDKIN